MTWWDWVGTDQKIRLLFSCCSWPDKPWSYQEAIFHQTYMVQPIGPRPWTQPFRPLTPPPHKSGDPPITSEGFYMSSHHANGRARKTEAFFSYLPFYWGHLCLWKNVLCDFDSSCCRWWAVKKITSMSSRNILTCKASSRPIPWPAPVMRATRPPKHFLGKGTTVCRSVRQKLNKM